MGSPELGALAGLHRAVRATGGTLRLVNVGRRVVGVLAACRLNTFLFVCPGGSTTG